jgi:hypothetical protein
VSGKRGIICVSLSVFPHNLLKYTQTCKQNKRKAQDYLPCTEIYTQNQNLTQKKKEDRNMMQANTQTHFAQNAQKNKTKNKKTKNKKTHTHTHKTKQTSKQTKKTQTNKQK